MKTTRAFTFSLLALCCASTVSAVTIDMVPVGNPGNPADTRAARDSYLSNGLDERRVTLQGDLLQISQAQGFGRRFCGR